MHYTARTVTAACAPWPLTIGRHTYHARPLSAALVLRVVPMMADPTTQAAAVVEALRAAFPKPRLPWWLGGRDAVRAMRRVDPAIQARIVQELFAIPGHHTERDPDSLASLIEEHRRMTEPVRATRGPTLALAALTCEVRLGAAWYYHPDRWPTVDGYAPVAVVWSTFVGLVAVGAQERLAMASAVQLANAHGPKVQAEWRKLEAAAYPDDPSMHGAAA